jgi:hypothetical protein
MAVVAGVDKPTAAQYNSIQTTIKTVLDYYGNSAASSQLSLPGTSTKISVTAWNNLRSDILKCNRHQQPSPGSLTEPTTGVKIAASDYNAYETMANACLTNYLSDSGNYNTVTNLTTATNAGGWGATGLNTLRHSFLLTWASATAANYFFNAGGKIRISSTFTGGTVATVGTKDYSWRSLVNSAGTQGFGYSTWTSLTGANSRIYTITSATYNPDKLEIYANKPGANSIQFYVEWEDLNDPGGYGIDENVTATASSIIEQYYASGVNQIDVSGYLPTISASVIAPIASPNPV